MIRGFSLTLKLIFAARLIAFGLCASLDVTTIYRNHGDVRANYSSVECHARTNALGLPFVTPNGSTFEPEVGLAIPSCQIGLTPNCPWTSQGWEITGGSNLSLPPLKLNPEIVRIRTSGNGMSQLVPLFWSRFNFSVKTSTRGIARVFLLTDVSLATTDMYVVDIVHDKLHLARQTSSVVKCGQGGQYVYDIDFGTEIGTRKCHSISNIYIRWASNELVMFKMDMSDGRIELWRNSSSVALFRETDATPLRVKYVAVATSEIIRDWTIHLDGRVWSLVGITGTLKSPILGLNRAHSNKVCVSFFAFMDTVPGSGIKVLAKFRNGSYEEIGHLYSSDWQNVRYIISGTSNKIYDESSGNYTFNARKWIVQRLKFQVVDIHDDVGIQIVIEGLKGNIFATVSIHGLIGCNPDDDEEIAVLQMPFDRSNPFICNVPTTYKKRGRSDLCPNCLHGGVCDSNLGQCLCPPGFIGDTCEEGCGPNAFGQDCLGLCSGREVGCKGLILCVPIVGCNCPPGYTGIDCNIECPLGRFGPRCTFECGSCISGSPCNMYTGVCTEGCATGYFPPLCNLTYSYLLTSPTVTKIGATAISFTFISALEDIAGAGDPSFYQIQIRETEHHSWISRTTRLLRKQYNRPITETVYDLNPGIEYMIRIILIDKDGSIYSNDSVVPYVTVATICKVPTTPLYYIETVWKMHHELQIEWKYEPNDHTACRLKQYRVYLSESWRRYLYNTTQENRIIISNVSPVFTYSVQVQAVTTHGPSVISGSVRVPTIETAPSQVIHLATKQLSPTEIDVHWDEPRSTYGEIKKYIIEYECLRYLACPETMECSNFTTRFETRELSIRIFGLHPHTQYEVRVAATNVEFGPWTRTKVVTLFATPDGAPKTADPAIISRTDSTLRVTWEPVEDCRLLHGFPLYYRYWLYDEDSDENQRMKLVAEGNVTHPPINFTHLRSYASYQVHIVQVVTGSLYNLNQTLTIAARTRGTVAGPVQELKATAIESTSMSLSWAPPFDVPSGVTLRFIINFACIRLLACDHFAHNYTNNGTFELNRTWVTLSNLKPYASYKIEVAPYTGEVGNFSTVWLSTLTAVPTIAPQLDPLRSLRTGTSWIALWWKSPTDCSRMHGPLRGYWYRIFKPEDDASSYDVISKTAIFTTNFWANFTKLSSFTVFRIEIAMANNMSHAPLWHKLATLNVTAWTKPEIPDAVANLVAYQNDDESVSLRWRPLGYQHGPIDSAEVHISNNITNSVYRIATVPCSIWKTFVCHDVHNLQPNITYRFEVRPYNSAVGALGFPAYVTARTIEEAPDPPSSLHLIHKTDRSVIVEWGHPNISHGILRSFHIVTEHVNSYASELCCDESMKADVVVFRENASYAAQIKGLKPASEYLIAVFAVTIWPSTASKLTIHTKPGVPSLKDNPPRVIHGSITPTTAAIVLSPVSEFNSGPIWAYFVMVCRIGDHQYYETTSDPFLIEIENEVKKEGFIAIALSEEELDSALVVTIGSGEESFGLYGFIRNQPLRPNTSYIAVQIGVSEYMGARSFGVAETNVFTTLPEN